MWMRVASLPHFRKLYGKIHEPLKEGDVVNVQVNSSKYIEGSAVFWKSGALFSPSLFFCVAGFPVQSFDGKKSIVLSETSFLGGKNPFLGIAYIVVGSISLGLGAIFLIKQIVSPRKPAETTFLQWTPSQ